MSEKDEDAKTSLLTILTTMIRLSDLIYENTEQNNTFKMYHGGTRWNLTPTELQPAKPKRYESGIGINFTNNFETARSYAKGNKVVHLVDIDKNVIDISKVNLDLKNLLIFLKDLKGLKKKKEIISDVIRYAEKRNLQEVPASVLNNLVINYEAGSGNIGLEIVNFFIKNGIDGTFSSQSGDEVWFVLFNLSKIKNVQIVNPKDKIEYMLPNPLLV